LFLHRRHFQFVALVATCRRAIALRNGYTLLTLDARQYQTAFPRLTIINV
jgi:hypothetical protein